MTSTWKPTDGYERVYVEVTAEDSDPTQVYELVEFVESVLDDEGRSDIGRALDGLLEGMGSAVRVGSCTIQEVEGQSLVFEVDDETGEEVFVESRWIFDCPVQRVAVVKDALVAAFSELHLDFDQPPITFGIAE